MTSVTIVEVSAASNDRGLRHLVRNNVFYVPLCQMRGANETTLRARFGGFDGLSCLWCSALLTRTRVSAPR